MKTACRLMGVALAFVAASAAQAATGNAQAGSKKVSTCLGCHGIPDYKASFPDVYRVPKLGGQHPAYIVKALTGYKTGTRSHPTMSAIAASLSEQDMADIAAYYGTQPGGGK